ncbi:ice-binding family protein [Polaribacter glomeratus]|uniref:DUF3494 domain-containing protein n=1 Tax=Polaribacter glomeratus TaxID=102 RepID=A0A2S7WF79_9FLAO|nr:ice-binding family protein [Polaribacter glomeratus]PQJ76270.1 hypothetical protein BTO16_10125 [Polaribacter glomeratus]TXD63814.1 DUF3494 domain-containing protein [Polaribacter glomeratus]
MRIIIKCILLQIILFVTTNVYAQLGIGTTSPDASSILDASSTSKGLLMPRLTTAQRDLIESPATGLMIYNTTINDGQLNTGTPSSPIWIGIKTPLIYSVNEGDEISTSSTDNSLVTGMTIAPYPGTYIALFNAQMSGTITTVVTQTFGSNQAVIDMAQIYQSLRDMPNGVSHGLVFGNGETLLPGVYDVTGATSIAGTLTLDGEGDSNSVFIIRGTAAFSTAAGTTVNLINGASSNNIFWVCETTSSTGVNTTMKGTLVSASAAISLGVNTTIDGSMFTKGGAISMGTDCTLSAPSGSFPIDLGILSKFGMFSSNGAVSDAANCTTTGDVGTASGAITFVGIHNGKKFPAGTEAEDVFTNTTNTTTYSIYLNGVEVANSSRTIKLLSSIVTLQAKVTVLVVGNPVEIRWKVGAGESKLKNRVLSLIRSEY